MAKPPRFLAYALPRHKDDRNNRVVECDGFELHDVPLLSPESFLDFDGVVVTAGAFEQARTDEIYGMLQTRCISQADLDLRSRECHTAISQKKTLIFLTPRIQHGDNFGDEGPQTDLFRKLMAFFEVGWCTSEQPHHALEASVPELRDYIDRHGTGYVEFYRVPPRLDEHANPVCTNGRVAFGLTLFNRVFILPCTIPNSHDQIVEVAIAAVTGVIAYQRRMLTTLPGWVAEFVFDREGKLRIERQKLEERIEQVESDIATYEAFKSALCFQSDPLVDVVSNVMKKFFGIELTLDDRHIEDATMRSLTGQIEALFEIKGVKGDFKWANVEQIKRHRERLRLPNTLPGVLMMNTFMEASSLKEKDQTPHHDIVKKAAADNVLMMRTLDLLRFAAGIEHGVLKRGEMRHLILTQAGWLRVENGKWEIRKQ